MDDELSQRARLLVAAGMEGDTPPPAIADGSWEMVVSRLTIEAAKVERVTPSAIEPPRARARWIVFVVVGAVIAATAALAWIVSRPRPQLDAKTAPPVTATKDPHAHAHTPSSTTAPTPAVLPVVVDAGATAKLLDEAEHATPEQALELLARHAELSALGPDSERRMAMRITTLCALGRTEDAKADAVAFLDRPRDAKWTAKVRTSCGAP